MAIASKKATFSLRQDLLEELDRAVRQGVARSKNALVEHALRRELDEIRREQRRADWEAARQDPLFLRDVEETEAAFRSADAEAARSIG